MRLNVWATRRFSSSWLLVLLALACTSTAVWGDPTEPTASDRQVTLAVSYLLRKAHLSGHPLDDEISQRCFQEFLDSLDPWKVYFYQSDVDRFRRHQNDLDDQVRKGDSSFAYEVFGTFLQRVDERVAQVDELLAMEHDFTADEKMLSDRDQARYPQTAAEARDMWRKRIKYDLLMLKVDDMEGEKAREKLRRRYHNFAKRMHQTDDDDLLEMFLNALSNSYDPHTSYMSPDTVKNFEIMMSLELEGIGAQLSSEDGYTTVKKVIPGGAADKQGELVPEDRIVGVGEGTDGEMVDTVDMKLSDVVKLIRGPKGTVVRLEVISRGNSKREIIEITRERIELKDNAAQAATFEVGRSSEGKPYKVGVIELTSFYMDMNGARNGNLEYKSTTRDVRRILDRFNGDGVDALVLDLRRNGGGSLTEAINLTGLFIDEGPVVQVKDSNGRIKTYPDLDPGTAWSGPLVVLVSKFSASASEILAGAIQDYRRGLIVGDRATHGKGTVQSLTDLGRELFRLPNAPAMGALKITEQQFYRPSGESTQKRGVVADVELPSLTNWLDIGERDLDYPIEWGEVPALDYPAVEYVNPALIDQLSRRSARRRQDSEDFQEVREDVTRYKEQKQRKYITLNEEAFLEQRAELNSDKAEKEAVEEISDPTKPPIERDYYLDEALAITADYLNLRQVAQAR